MEDSSKNFVQTLRDRLADFTSDEDNSTDTSGYDVEEHEFEELDERTQTAVNKMFDTMRISREQLKGDDIDAFATVRTKTLSSI